MALALIEAWLPRTATGDRAEIDDLPEDLPFWPDVSATTENCLGNDCPRYQDCFVTKMRQRAAEADVVIVNHHLLCADASVRQHSFGAVIPEAPLLVVDEAHQLEDVATQYFGVTVSNYRLEEFVRDARPGVPHAAGHADQSTWRRCVRPCHGSTRRRVRCSRRCSGSARARRRGHAEGGGLFDERLRLTDSLLDVVGESGLLLTDALGSVETDDRAGQGGARRPAGARPARALSCARRCGSCCAPSIPAFVFFLEIRGRGVFLRRHPDRRVGHRARAPAATVARHRAHLGDAGRQRVLRVHAEPPGRRGCRGAAAGVGVRLRRAGVALPAARHARPAVAGVRAQAAREIVDILQHSEGRAFVLFTSYANLRDVHARIASQVPYPLMVQGDAPRGVLVEQFRRTANAVLLATSSFWQGVDVVGDALSCVIIDKLPFASPGDPVVQARIEAITEAGGDAFQGYQVPLAILTLLQGLGRLLRHRTDRGVLAVLDPRLRTMGYGRRFMEALPPARRTHRIEDVQRFFGPPRPASGSAPWSPAVAQNHDRLCARCAPATNAHFGVQLLPGSCPRRRCWRPCAPHARAPGRAGTALPTARRT